MKPTSILIALSLCATSLPLLAQDAPPPPPPGGGGPDGPRPVPPLIAALDSNHDGVIDAVEIAQAAESLKKLDKNADGKITEEEYRPMRPPGQAGPGPQGGGGEPSQMRPPGEGQGRPGGKGQQRPPAGGQGAPGKPMPPRPPAGE